MAVVENSGPPAGSEDKKETSSEETLDSNDTGTPTVPAGTEEAPTEVVAPEAKEDPENAESNSEEETSEDDDTPITRRKARELRNEARNLRVKNKGLIDEVETLKASLSEAEQKLTEATEKVTEIQVSSIKKAVQEKYSFTERQMKYVSGSTAEEIENSAKELFEDLNPAGSQTGISGLKVSGGKASTSDDVSNMTADEIVKKFKR